MSRQATETVKRFSLAGTAASLEKVVKEASVGFPSALTVL